MVFFFYGTLMNRETLRHVVGDAAREEIGEGSVAGTLYDLGEYPGLILGGDGRVPGMLIDVDAAAVPRLDEYEGVDTGLYARRAVSVETGVGKVIAVTYEYLGSVAGLPAISRWEPRPSYRREG